jgi:hypothetical protein
MVMTVFSTLMARDYVPTMDSKNNWEGRNKKQFTIYYNNNYTIYDECLNNIRRLQTNYMR